MNAAWYKATLTSPSGETELRIAHYLVVEGRIVTADNWPLGHAIGDSWPEERRQLESHQFRIERLPAVEWTP